MKIAHYCMDNPEHIFSGNNLDGIRCPYCEGLVNVMTVANQVYEKLPKYRELKKKYRCRHKARCLNCYHTDMIYIENKEDYQEVKVCPSCNVGALVDVWKIHKYLSDYELPTRLEGSE